MLVCVCVCVCVHVSALACVCMCASERDVFALNVYEKIVKQGSCALSLGR
jgi:hypothetical protein